MKQDHPEHQNDVLIHAQDTIARQASEIESLRQQLKREHFAQELSRLLISAQSMNIVLSPFTHSQLLHLVVNTAAQVIAARSGSLFLIDEIEKELVFEVAIGPAAREAKKFSVPLGHGIAGMVAATGQPMAIADAQQDGRVALDIATAINYIPESILCVPLFYNDRIIGALELLDKIDAPSFRPADIETLGLFAHIAAVAIAQSQAYHDQQTVLTSLLRSFGKLDHEHEQRLNRGAIDFVNWTQSEIPINSVARDLAILVHELIQSGERESEMCKQILLSFIAPLRNRKQSDDVLASAW